MPESRWHFGLGLRLPLSSETNFRLASGFFLRTSEFGLIDDVTTVQSWVIKNSKKPFLRYFHFDFLFGTEYLISPDVANELALKFRPRLSMPT